MVLVAAAGFWEGGMGWGWSGWARLGWWSLGCDRLGLGRLAGRAGWAVCVGAGAQVAMGSAVEVARFDSTVGPAQPAPARLAP